MTNFVRPAMVVNVAARAVVRYGQPPSEGDRVNESEPPASPVVKAHRVSRMAGRDPHEDHRVATPLELLFDLTFVIAFGVAGSEFAHMLAAGHGGVGIVAFAFATFATCWAWINFTWFASAYDTDDWVYRVLT